MRHKVYGKHLGRNKNQRTALFKSLVQSLIISGSIQTTEAKAKSIKPTVDKIINQAKSRNTQRLLQQFLAAKPIREKLIKDIVPALKDRSSGYTSLVKLGPRLGDGAMMVRMSLLVSEKGKVESAKSANTSEGPARSADESPVETQGKSKVISNAATSEVEKKPARKARPARTSAKKGAAKKS